jgi:hypothetical protein
VVDSLEALWLSFQDLIAQVVGQLVRRGLGARQLAVTFVRPYAPRVKRTIELSSPSRNASILFNLIRCTMESIGDVQPKRSKRPARFKLHGSALTLDESEFVPRGFTGLRLAVPVFERLTEEQIYLLEQAEHAGRQELDRLAERLRIRLGQEGLLGVQAVESYMPERAYQTWHGRPARDRPSSRREEESWAGRPCHESRPLHLLLRPREIRVIVRPSEDRDGAPVAFELEGRSHRIVHAVGPERIAGAWWLGHDKTRDYFDVEDEGGRRWWVFRVFQTSRWFLHGNFE